MREIKFRGIAFHNMEFVYGDLCHSQRCPQIIVNGNGLSDYFPVKEETIGQFTGLHDKNGKEIYEGDIVKVESLWCEKECTMIVSWMEDTGRWFMYYTKNHGYLYPQDLEEIEVIGNIHEKKQENEQ